jgi:hypothetical protein
MNDIVKKENVNMMVELLRQRVQENQSVAIVGDLLLYKKGDWSRGTEKREVPLGTRFTANLDQLWIGWVKYSDGRIVDARFGRLTAGYKRPSRQELGDSDPDLWETDRNGDPVDPWVKSDRLIMRDEKGELVTFSTHSVGGRDAIDDLLMYYVDHCYAHPGMWPVVELGSVTYQHRDYGPTKKPEFVQVDWAPMWDEPEDVFGAGEDLVGAKAPRSISDAKVITKAPDTSDLEMEDEIEF